MESDNGQNGSAQGEAAQGSMNAGQPDLKDPQVVLVAARVRIRSLQPSGNRVLAAASFLPESGFYFGVFVATL